MVWSEGSGELPDGKELARWLAGKVGFRGADEDDLLRVSQYTETTLGDGELYVRVRQAFDCEPAPTPVHRFLAALPERLRSAHGDNPNLLIVTTNYDDAMERALTQADEPYDVVTYVAKGANAGSFEHLPSGEATPHRIEIPNEYDQVSPSRQTVVLKLHGAVDRADATHDSYVITEDNYIDYLATTDPVRVLPAPLAAKLQSSHILFLGYGLKDWNLRVILRRLWGAQVLTFTSWAVQLDPDDVEERFWSRRGVEIRDAELAAYVDELSAQISAHLGA
jgi:hypothetical protein